MKTLCIYACGAYKERTKLKWAADKKLMVFFLVSFYLLFSFFFSFFWLAGVGWYRKMLYYWLRLFAMYRSFSIPLSEPSIVSVCLKKKKTIARVVFQTNFLRRREDIFLLFIYFSSCAAGSTNIEPRLGRVRHRIVMEFGMQCAVIHIKTLE